MCPAHPTPILRPITELIISDCGANALTLKTSEFSCSCERINIIGKPGCLVEGIRLSDLRLRCLVLDDAIRSATSKTTRSSRGNTPDARAANAACVVRYARDIEIGGVRLHWLTYPVGEWNLFVSDNRHASSFWRGHEDDIRTGKYRVAHHVVWARDAEMRISGRHLTASEPGHPLADTDASSIVTLDN